MTSNLITATFLAYRDMLELLDALPAHEADGLTAAEIASRTGRVASNLRRDTAKFEREGYLAQGGDASRFVLGETGRAALAAWRKIDATPVTGDTPLWPIDKFRRNPDQPRKSFPDEMIVDRAESIVAAGGILHALVVDPADEHGMRMIQDGECRWRAVQLLAQQDRLPEALRRGLPYVERQGGEAQMLKVALIANAQRSDLTPWEDAQALKRLKDLEKLSARGVAMLLGRAKEGSERGVADVQQKIRTAEKATPENIKLHEEGLLSWEGLRDSVREARALSPHAALAIAELRWKVEENGRHADDDVSSRWVLTDGQGPNWASHRELVQAGLIEDQARVLHGILSPLVRITDSGVAWMAKALMPGLRDGDDLQALDYVRAGWGRMEGRQPVGDMDEGYITPWLNAQALMDQLERRRQGLPDPQTDLEEAIAAKAPEPTALDRVQYFSAEVRDDVRGQAGNDRGNREKVSGKTTIEGEAWPAEATEILATPWTGAPAAEIRLTVSSTGRWHACISTQQGSPGYAGSGDAFGVWTNSKLWPSRGDALAYAAARIVKQLGEWGAKRKLQDWLAGIANGTASARPAMAAPTEDTRRDAAEWVAKYGSDQSGADPQRAVTQRMAEVRAELSASTTQAESEPENAETFDDIEQLERNALASRVNSCMGLRRIRREVAGKPPLDDRDLADIADDAVGECMSGSPFVAAMHLATLALRARRDNLLPTAADDAWKGALQRWKDRRDQKVLMTLKVGDLVNNGGASDYRLISRKDHHDSRVFDFVVQPILHGRDYGGQRAMNLSQIQRLGGANTNPPTPTAVALQTGGDLPALAELASEEATADQTASGSEDIEDAESEDQYRDWIAEALIREHKVDEASADGFAAQAFVAAGLASKFGKPSGVWTRSMAAFDASDWAGDHLQDGQLKEPSDAAA